MKILLVCSMGMSTSLLVEKMKQFADEEDSIKAVGLTDYKKEVDNGNVETLLVGPQVKMRFKEISNYCEPKGIRVELIDTLVYGRMNGEAAMQIAKGAF